MRAGFDRWWLLPFGILTASALITLCIAVFGAPESGRPSAQDISESSGGHGLFWGLGRRFLLLCGALPGSGTRRGRSCGLRGAQG